MLWVTFMVFSCLSTLKTNEFRSIEETTAERLNAKRRYSQPPSLGPLFRVRISWRCIEGGGKRNSVIF